MTRIKVNVFNLTPLNKVFSCCKVGVYHTSVVINEEYEYYYGYCQWGITGVDSPEELNKIPSIMCGTFHSSYDLGESHLSVLECVDIATQFKLSPRWLSDRYHLLNHNCNTFSRELCSVLVDSEAMKKYPYWVSRGENIASVVYRISFGHFLAFVKKIPCLGTPMKEEKTNKHKESFTDETVDAVDNIETVDDVETI